MPGVYWESNVTKGAQRLLLLHAVMDANFLAMTLIKQE